jgi:glycosyltransferase involved in cell wall biosynthesis
MRVTVVVPLYNKVKYVQRCLASIAAQTIQDFEAIIVDDGSTDGGAAIAESYGDPRFRVVRQANAGPGEARNLGIAQALGEYTAFLDADDKWLPLFLERNIPYLDKYPEALCVSGGSIHFPEGLPCKARWTPRGIVEGLHTVSPATPVPLFTAMVAYMTPSMTLARTEALRRWGGFYGGGCRFAEDAMLWLKFLLNGSVYLHFDPLTEFHKEASTLSRNYQGPRPVEPYLCDPEALRTSCRPELRPLLESFLTSNACKTACMLGYWGEWRRARELVRRFVKPGDWKKPLFAAALLSGTPLGGLAGSVLRRVAPRREKPVPAAAKE